MANNNNLTRLPTPERSDGGQVTRPPIVVVLGHVDSGKTSILDFIRKAHVAQGESGGITQRIGAYQIDKDGRKITFLDTPGHEAFSAMRARGAKAADIAILVVDACKGVEPQTKEAILHIKKAEIPLIVAMNKIDRPEADPEKTKRDLSKEGVLAESLGGKVPVIEVSALTGKRIEDLLEMIFIVAEMENLKADLSKPAEGWVLESQVSSQTGIVVSLILSDGVLKVGDIVGTDSALGKIKNLEDFQGKMIEKAFPSDPVLTFGFGNLPQMGESFKILPDIATAQSQIKEKQENVLESPLANKAEKVLNLIIKADYLGSIEAIKEVLKEIPQEKVSLNFLKTEVGDINEADVKLAKGGKAKILGFRVKANSMSKTLALREKIRIVNFEVIYELVEAIRNLMESQLSPEISRIDLGKARVLAVFSTDKNRQVLGGRVSEGQVERGSQIEILRNEETTGSGKLVNLQRNKKDIDKCGKGEECGFLYEGATRVEKDDILVFFKEQREKGEL